MDLPGYGYATASLKIKKNWQTLISEYLQYSSNLKRLFLLINAQHGITSLDRVAMQFLDDIVVNYQLVLTKIDKVNSLNISDYDVTEQHPAMFPQIIATSAKNHDGIISLRQMMTDYINSRQQN